MAASTTLIFRWYAEWREQLIELIVVGNVVWALWGGKMAFTYKLFFANQLICEHERRLRAGTQQKVLLRGEIVEKSAGLAACASCGETHEPPAKYCRRCGSELRAESASPIEAIIDISVEYQQGSGDADIYATVRPSVFVDAAPVRLLSEEDIEEIKGS